MAWVSCGGESPAAKQFFPALQLLRWRPVVFNEHQIWSQVGRGGMLTVAGCWQSIRAERLTREE